MARNYDTTAAQLNPRINRHIDGRDLRLPGGRGAPFYAAMSEAATLMALADAMLAGNEQIALRASEVLGSFEGYDVRRLRQSRWAGHLEGERYQKGHFDAALDTVAKAAAPIVERIALGDDAPQRRNGEHMQLANTLEDMLRDSIEGKTMSENEAKAIMILLREIAPTSPRQVETIEQLREAARRALQQKINNAKQGAYNALNLVIGRPVDSQPALSIAGTKKSHPMLRHLPAERQDFFLEQMLIEELTRLYSPIRG
ncbi:MAG TPA: hypothetical protein VL362_00635 [Patescibacteria group bacterium]|nr:hypothetical protein [Patescibacteria group bacterium]